MAVDPELKAELEKLANTVSSGMHTLGREVHHLRSHVIQLWKHVHASDPPPSLISAPPDELLSLSIPPLAEDHVPLDAQVTGHELELQALRGDILTMRREMAPIGDMQRAQSKAMGLSPAPKGTVIPLREQFATFILSREGANFFLRLVTAVGVAYAIAHGYPIPGGHP